jgi:hypothetical protein
MGCLFMANPMMWIDGRVKPNANATAAWTVSALVIA